MAAQISKINRRQFFTRISLGAGALLFVQNSVSAQKYMMLTSQQAQAALRCPNENAREFVDDCFTLVNRGRLPEIILISAFQYAISKPQNQWYYFEQNITLRSEKIGINLAKEISNLKKS